MQQRAVFGEEDGLEIGLADVDDGDRHRAIRGGG